MGDNVAVRDRISEYLARRGGFNNAFNDPTGTMWAVSIDNNPSRLTCVVLDARSGLVEARYRYAREPDLSVPATAPDLLERLGATLDGLGV